MLKRLSEAVGVSGNEKKIRDIIINELPRDFSFNIDSIGNIIVSSTPKSDCPTVIIYAHMDEPGIIITDITDDGYLKFDIIGDIDVSSLISQRIKIENILGIISLKAVHLTTKEERQRKVKVSDLFVDIGTSKKEEAQTFVSPGDYGSFVTSFCKLTGGYLKGKALSSRIGCSVLIDVMKQIHKYNLNIVAVFTAQKEIAGRGAIVSTYSIPDSEYIILLDSSDASYNSNSKNQIASGAIICSYNNISQKSMDLIVETEKWAKDYGIQIQRAVINKKSETLPIITNKANANVIPVNIPCKYLKTGINVASEKDIASLFGIVDIILRRIEDARI